MAAGMNPVAKVGFGKTRVKEETMGIEMTRYPFRITQQEKYGVVWWGFTVHDRYMQEEGIDIPEDDLPTVNFKLYHGDSNKPAPDRMDIVIASHWSMIPPSEPPSNRFHKFLQFLRLNKSSGDTQNVSYSNLFQIVSVKTSMSNPQKESRHVAEVEVRPGAIGLPQVVQRAEDPVEVTPAVFDGM